MNKILTQNKASWDAMADDWFGVTALPIYGCLCPAEGELHLFGDITGKKVLDIGCGSGHSLSTDPASGCTVGALVATAGFFWPVMMFQSPAAMAPGAAGAADRDCGIAVVARQAAAPALGYRLASSRCAA